MVTSPIASPPKRARRVLRNGGTAIEAAIGHEVSPLPPLDPPCGQAGIIQVGERSLVGVTMPAPMAAPSASVFG